MSDQANAAKETLRKQAEIRTGLNEAAARVMENSKPTPSQEENDLAKLGVIVEDKEEGGEEMPALAEQQAAVAAAGEYQTRTSTPSRRGRRAESGEGAGE